MGIQFFFENLHINQFVKVNHHFGCSKRSNLNAPLIQVLPCDWCIQTRGSVCESTLYLFHIHFCCQEVQEVKHPHMYKGPFTQDGDHWVPIEWSKIGPISQRSLKSNKKAFPCALNHVSFGVGKVGVHWKIAERSMRLSSASWVLLDHSLRDRWEIVSLGDHWEIVLDWVKTLRRPWRPWRSLDSQWEIIERSGHFFIA